MLARKLRTPVFVLLFALAAALAGLLAACDGGSKTNGGSNGGLSDGPGLIVIAGPDGISEYDVASGTTTPLIPRPGPGAFLFDPAFSPDFQRMVYVQQPPPVVVDGRFDAGADLWIADRDGSNQRMLFEHAAPNQLVRFPQWQDAGNVLAVIQEITEEAGVSRVVYTLQRINVETGERTKVLDNSLSFAVSPDADRIAYAALSAQPGETLESVSVAGTDPRTLVGREQNLMPFNAPRYRPDGALIAFASADQTGAFAGDRYVSAASLAPAAAPLLDGLPQDIWTVDAAGGQAVRIAVLKEDVPSLTWNGDGSHIYVLGVTGLYDVVIESGAVNRIGEGIYHAQIAWTPSR